jgi:imidazolonepropionase-like amidohydrolase
VKGHGAHGDSAEAGLSQQVLSYIVKKSHQAGLRVTAHVDTAADFQRAVDAGVDEMGHLPIADPPDVENADYANYLISDDLARKAAAAGVVVVATANVVARFRSSTWRKEDWENVINVHRSNIGVLMKHGVRIAIGSDGISGETPFFTARDEAMFLWEHGLLNSRSILKAWSEVTPMTIFPDRKIGRIEPGYEANFLILEGNPIEDFNNIKKISLRVKSGVEIQLN